MFCIRAERKLSDDDDDDDDGLSSLNSPVDSGNYQLFITKQIDCNVDKITNLVQQYVPEYSLMSNLEAQIMYNLPARKRSQFGPLFSALEFQKQNFKLNSIKITNPTTGDIYPK